MKQRQKKQQSSTPSSRPKTTATTATKYQIILIGDSDIAYWPSELYPTNIIDDVDGEQGGKKEEEVDEGTSKMKTTDDDAIVICTKSGHSGATLEDILPYLRETIICSNQQQKCFFNNDDDSTTVMKNPQPNNNTTITIFVACAGENDIGNNIRLDDSIHSLQQFLDIVFDDDAGEKQKKSTTYLIFLGPKFEPWLNDDYKSKKQYTKMSRAFQRTCCNNNNNSEHNNNNNNKNNIYYIDCITMFCTNDTINKPGSILGGLAMADTTKYFSNDLLHLSHNGYTTWKHCIEKCIRDNII